MLLQSSFVLSCLSAVAVSAGLSDNSLESHANVLALDHDFNPIKEAYWTGYPHHRRTPFAVSPDGKSAYLAYLDSSETDVHIQQVDPSTFKAVGSAVTVTGGKEAGGLVAHNDGFALLTNEALPSGTANAPAGSTPVPVVYRYTGGKQTWKTFIGGPSVKSSMGLEASPDINGDLVYSEAAGLYGAYIVVTAYSGEANGHFGDAIRYLKQDGALQTINGASSDWGCSHNTGIAFEAADEAPFASLCAEDQGEIWLNTKTQGMSGVKVSNENTTNGASNEAMGGMSGSYSGLARFIGKSSYIFAWVSRGAKDLTANEWLGGGNTHSVNRTVNRNVAIAQFSDKNTLVGKAAISQVGAADGDSQVNWITTGTADCSNAHVAAFDGENALVTWEEIEDPKCYFTAMGCMGKFSGAYYQLVNNGAKVGEPVKSMNTYVAGDMVTMTDGRVCWPYVNMTWSLDGPANNGWGGSTSSSNTKSISFACMSLNGTASSNPTSGSASSAVAASSTSAPAVSSVVQEAATTPVSSAQSDPTSEVAPIPISSAQPDSSSKAAPSQASLPVEASPASSTAVEAQPTDLPSFTPVSEVPSQSTPAGQPEDTGLPSFPTEGGSLPSAVPFPSGGAGFPTPSDGAFPTAWPWWPSGVAFPTGRHRGGHHGGFGGFGKGFPSGAAFPTGGFGGFGSFGGRPEGFETRVRPTSAGATAAQAQQTPCTKVAH